MRRIPKILIAYILREHIFPFIFGFSVITLIFIVNILFRDLGKFLSKGIALPVILEFLFLNLAWMIALSVPMAVLTSTLMAFGRLSADNEITAMRAGGISFYQILPPLVLVATLIAVFLIWFNNHVLPDFNHRARLLATDIARKKPTLNLEEGVYYTDIPNYNLIVEKLKEEEGVSYVENITIQDKTEPNKIKTIAAARGEIRLHQNTGLLEIILYSGELQELDLQRPEAFRRIHFTRHVLNIPVSDMILKRSKSGYRGDREKSAQQLLQDIRKNNERIKKSINALNRRIKMHMAKYAPWPQETSQDSLDLPSRRLLAYKQKLNKNKIHKKPEIKNVHELLMEHKQLMRQIDFELNQIESFQRANDMFMVEVHKKYSIPVACIVFILIGAPLGMMARQGGLAAAAMSVVFFLIYWICLIGGEHLADRQIISPFWAMWTPNIVVGLAGIYLVIRSIRETKFIHWQEIQQRLIHKFKKQDLSYENS